MIESARFLAAVATLGVVACDAGAQPAPFAIACTGTAKFTNKLAGDPKSSTYPLPKQVYVLDEHTKSVQRALIPRQQFEDVCIRGGYVESVMFSPGLISVRSEKTDYMCDFKVSRVTGESEFFSHQDLPGGGYSEIQSLMNCSPAEIPVFDTSKNRF